MMEEDAVCGGNAFLGVGQVLGWLQDRLLVWPMAFLGVFTIHDA
jgi:hypothetical protein